ncbi:dihydropteroate synthase [Candidatus Methylomirabilis lanthanidiphila]|uniref:Dihydropteroate synthase n=1 Tax=Candidatus Methylomirabilis lanthanidiphila TaxID=2211376 RepID=A0A564ZHR4_9BACT|nr:dihydropteroate synthase [Candidatus Methylomirabilis lanthanidiphila]VUZ84824.1 dihydropteroate synthase [Candidatus Methylomirabilis lanthanidiphila]
MTPSYFRCRDHLLDVQDKTWIIGVLNITPDSFSDGGRFLDPGAAIDQAMGMIEEGADILELGGESTRPGAIPVPVREELRRIVPVLCDLRPKVTIPIAVDTYKPEVARVVLEEGADIINDVYGVRGEGRLAVAVAEKRAGLVIMHMQGTPQDMQVEPRYRDVVGEVSAFLADRVACAERLGVDPQSIIVDPGLGFGKRGRDNLALLRHLEALRRLGKPIMVGPSRKSLVGDVLKLPVEQRQYGTAACVAAAVLHGAAFVRVHEIRPCVHLVRMLDAIRRA